MEIYGGNSTGNGAAVIIPPGVASFVIYNLGVNGLGATFENVTVTTKVANGVGGGPTTSTFIIPLNLGLFGFAPQSGTQYLQPLNNSSSITVAPGPNSQVFVSWTA